MLPKSQPLPSQWDPETLPLGLYATGVREIRDWYDVLTDQRHEGAECEMFIAVLGPGRLPSGVPEARHRTDGARCIRFWERTRESVDAFAARQAARRWLRISIDGPESRSFTVQRPLEPEDLLLPVAEIATRFAAPLIQELLDWNANVA